MVLKNLLLGLKRSGQHYSLNKKPGYNDKVHVISGVNTLKWAIQQKKEGRISELIAGPNICITPRDHKSILTDKNINKVLVASPWTETFFAKIAPEIRDRLYVWPAGTECNIETNSQRRIVLLYKKQVDEKLFDDISQYLETNGHVYETIVYGTYNLSDYHKKLSESRILIYLQESESQGLALQEAWAYNVPTLVWNKKLDFNWNKDGYVIDPKEGLKIQIKSSAPYLTKESGEFFENFDEFKKKFPRFISRTKDFTPAKYCRENLSIEKSTEIYIGIINHKITP